MANSRYYSSIGQQTTLTSGITSSGTTMIVAATTGFPGSLPYTLAVDYGSATEELVEVTGVAGTTLTVTRAIDGTSGASHNPGAVVRHVSSARDFTDSRTHEASASGVHGVTGSVVGTSDTQTLTNKTLTHALGSADNFKLYNKGAVGVTQIIGDSTNPSPNRLEVLDDEASLNVMAFINSAGAIKSISRSTDSDVTYRLRLTDNNGTTDRFAVLAGGTISITPTGTTTQVGIDYIAPDLSTSKRAIRVAASGGGSERFTVWNDGRVDIVGSAAAFSQFDIRAASGQSADIMRVRDNADTNTLFGVQSTGRMLANVGGTIAQPGVTSGTVLQVGGSNAGYTGNLQTWVSPSNTILGQVNEIGQFTMPTGIFTDLTVSNTTWSTYTPIVGGGGAATFSTATGSYYKLGKIVHVVIYLVVNVAGTGTSIVTVTTPSNPDRAIRQAMTIHAESIGANGNATSSIRGGEMVSFTSGSGATWDRLRVDNGTSNESNIQGVDLLANGILVIQGWYKEA